MTDDPKNNKAPELSVRALLAPARQNMHVMLETKRALPLEAKVELKNLSKRHDDVLKPHMRTMLEQCFPSAETMDDLADAFLLEWVDYVHSSRHISFKEQLKLDIKKILSSHNSPTPDKLVDDITRDIMMDVYDRIERDVATEYLLEKNVPLIAIKRGFPSPPPSAAEVLLERTKSKLAALEKEDDTPAVREEKEILARLTALIGPISSRKKFEGEHALPFR